MNLSEVVVVVYGVIVALGGLVGYLKARSKRSLVIGMLFGWALIGSIFAPSPPPGSLPASFWMTLGISAVFIGRLYSTRRFMPAGLLVLLSAVVVVVLLVDTFLT